MSSTSAPSTTGTAISSARLALNHFHTTTHGLLVPWEGAPLTITEPQRQHTVMLQKPWEADMLAVRPDLRWLAAPILQFGKPAPPRSDQHTTTEHC